MNVGARQRPNGRVALWRVIFVRVLDPRPRWWLRTWLWLLVGVVGYYWLGETQRIDGSGNWSQQVLVLESPDGALRWFESGGLEKGTRIWKVTGTLRYAYGPGFRLEAAESDATLEEPRTGQSPARAKVDQLVEWLVAHSKTETHAHVWELSRSPDRASARLMEVLRKPSQRIEDLRWWRIAAGYARFACLGIVGLCPIVAFLRLVQEKWFRLQLRRYADYQCPNCAYDLRGLASATCPECGVNIQGAIDEASWMLYRARDAADWVRREVDSAL